MIRKIKAIFLSDMIIKKIIAYSVLFALAYFLKDFLGLFLLVFLFAFLTYKLASFIKGFFKKYIKKENKLIKFFLSINFISSILYLLYIFLIVFFVSNLVPLFLQEIKSLSSHFPLIGEYTKNFVKGLSSIQHVKTTVSADISKVMTEKNIDILINTIKHIKLVGGELVKFFIAFVLSYFFIIDRKRLHKYLEGIKSSSLKFLYDEYAFLFTKIAKGFFLIYRAQAKIAITNTILTFIGLHIIAFIIGHYIPYLFLLTFIVFIFSFVPVLGVIISSIPISLVVYNIAGFHGVLYVIGMITLIHMIEAYILNPNFISEEVELPVSLTFLILFIGEHIFGPIGLIISIPIFYILLEIFTDIDKKLKNKS